MKDRWSRVAAAALAVTLAFGPATMPLATAVEEAEESGGAAGEAAESEGPNRGRVSLLVQNDFTNAYFFRGILQERDGFIWQPYAEVSLNLYESDEGFLRSVTPGMGVWNSFQTRKTLAEHSPTNLYETDWYPFLSVDLPGGVNFTTIYWIYTSPNGAFDTVQEVELDLAWDDSALLGRWALNPSVGFVLETDRTSFGDKRGSACVVGIEPTLYEFENEMFPLSFSLPVQLGLSIDNYYEEPGRSNDTFGYLSWGLTGALPLPYVPEGFGSWSIKVTGTGYYFSNALTRANRGDRLYPVVMGSLVLEY